LENLVLVAHHSEKLLRLQPLTMAPFDRNLILVDRLSYEHRIWLNNYHEQVQNTLLPGLSALAQAWLTEQTQPL
jgi:Xaa-Pro aminopeptidase